MTNVKVLECNVQELNQMYYAQLKRATALSEQNRHYRRIIEDLVESWSIGETPTLQDLNLINEQIRID